MEVVGDHCNQLAHCVRESQQVRDELRQNAFFCSLSVLPLGRLLNIELLF